MTDFRLLQLGQDSRGEVLPKGQPTLLAEGVLVTLADNDGNVMIEHATGSARPVAVDGKPVYEVAHLRPLQVIETEGKRFVLMPPYGAFIQERSGKESVQVREAKAKKTKAKAKAQASEPRRLRLIYVAPLALLAIIGAGLSLVPEQKPAEAVTEQGADEEVTTLEGEAEAEAEVEAEADVPAQASSAHPVPEVPIILNPVQPAPVEVAAAAPAAAPAPATAPEAAPAPAPAPKAAKQAESKATEGKSLPPEREASIRSMAESYQLEGGFDPEGAQKKLRALKKQVPANARVQKDIDRALKAVGG